MYLLNQVVSGNLAEILEFTFHYVSIKSYEGNKVYDFMAIYIPLCIY